MSKRKLRHKRTNSSGIVNSETNVDAYTLNMVEDDGEVDCDFPPLDSREPISKFGFNKLALVVKSVIPRSAAKQSTDVTVLVIFQFAPDVILIHFLADE